MIIQKDQIPALLDHLAQDRKVYVPGFIDGVSKFIPWGGGNHVRLDIQNTKLPPKDLLFPSTEKMYRWSRHHGELTIEQEDTATEPFMLFGIRPCDMQAIERLDDVFLTKGYVDQFYAAKREAMLSVVHLCTEPKQTCFCDSMGGNPNVAAGADIVLNSTGEGYVVTAQTEKGEAELGGWKQFALDAAAEAEQPAPTTCDCDLKVNMEGVCEALPDLFESDLWNKVSNTCLTCGTCTFVCPTCHCFDISQDRRAEEGERFRCWDSCMFTDYTLMAGNHNPRSQKSQRVRQRFMHKLCYFEQRYGSPLCVGCGRCLIDCPASVDITRVIDAINETKSEKAAEAATEGA